MFWMGACSLIKKKKNMMCQHFFGHMVKQLFAEFVVYGRQIGVEPSVVSPGAIEDSAALSRVIAPNLFLSLISDNYINMSYSVSDTRTTG